MASIQYVCLAGVSASGGIHLNPSQDFVFVNGSRLVTHGTPITPHGDSRHNSAVTSNTIGILFINGIRVSRAGERATCDHANASNQTFMRSS